MNLGPVIATPITLTEFELAAWLAVRRQAEAMRGGRPDAHGYKGDGIDLHTQGALAEMALAKTLNMYWQPTNGVYRQLHGDVGIYECRYRSNPSWNMIIRADDDDNGIYVLAVPFKPTPKAAPGPLDPVYWVRFVGWIFGKEAKFHAKQDPTGGREPVYFIPQVYLHAWSSLPRPTAATFEIATCMTNDMVDTRPKVIRAAI